MFYLRQLQLCGPSSINSLISPAGLQRWEDDGWSLEIRGQCFHSFRASNLKGTSTPLRPSGHSSPSHHITSISNLLQNLQTWPQPLSSFLPETAVPAQTQALGSPDTGGWPGPASHCAVSVVRLCFLNNPNMHGRHFNRFLLLVSYGQRWPITSNFKNVLSVPCGRAYAHFLWILHGHYEKLYFL